MPLFAKGEPWPSQEEPFRQTSCTHAYSATSFTRHSLRIGFEGQRPASSILGFVAEPVAGRKSVIKSTLVRSREILFLYFCQRSGDLIRPKREKSRSWDPARDTHRGRITGEWAYDYEGHSYRRLILKMKPTKTDVSGEEHWEKSFRVDNTENALSAGAAITNMLLQDPDPPGTLWEQKPLFRDPLTGAEITYEQSSTFLHKILQQCGYDTVTLKNHSLRIGGATAISNDPAGGDFVAGCAGLWTSDCKFKYFHVIREKLESVAYFVGRENGGSLALRPGAFASYSC